MVVNQQAFNALLVAAASAAGLRKEKLNGHSIVPLTECMAALKNLHGEFVVHDRQSLNH